MSLELLVAALKLHQLGLEVFEQLCFLELMMSLRSVRSYLSEPISEHLVERDFGNGSDQNANLLILMSLFKRLC